MSTLSSRIHNGTSKLNDELRSGTRTIQNGPLKVKGLLHHSQTPKAKKSSSQPIYYSSVFEKVYNKRLTFFKRIAGALSFVLAIALKVLNPSASIFMAPIKAIFIFGSFIFIESSRELTLTVEFNSRYTSLSSQIAGELVSKRFINTLLGYSIASILYFLVIYFQIDDKNFTYYITSPTKTIKPLINDEFVYFWFHATVLAIAYAIQHAVFLKSKLNFKIGVSKTPPKDEIFSRQLEFVKTAATITGLVGLGLPLLYRILRSVIYKIVLYPVYWPLGLNHKMPFFKLSAFTVIYISIADFLVVYTWELINHIFNVYASVGCITAGKNLSSLSKDPVNTLLSGLRDAKRPLVRLTAFQELAHISTSENSKLREFLYTSHFKNSYVWGSILEECSKVIEETSKRVRARPNVLRSTITAPVTGPQAKTKPDIFGNSGSGSTAKRNEDNSHYSLKPAGMISPQKATKRSTLSIVNDDMEPIDLRKFLAPVLKFLEKYYKELLSSQLGKPFRPTLKREADARLINPVIYGDAIISVAYIAISAEFEDKKNIVISTLPEILSLLEKAVTSTKSFIDFPPVKGDTKEETSIQVLHDLSLRLFFEIVVKYNHMLKDFALSQSVFNLSKWCIDLAIEQQKKEESGNSW